MKIISADITGSLIINNQDVTTTVESSSIWSGSIASRVTNLEQFSSSLDTTFATDQQLNQATASLSGSIALLSSSYLATSQSYDIVSSSYSSASGSFSTRVTTLEAASSSLNTASGSFSTRVTNNEATGSSLTTASGSFSTRVTTIESKYATTGSNTYTGPQYINEGSNAISFTSTASLYTDGGLRVTKDAFVSGTMYLNNLTVYGTSSIQYATSSQLNVGTNIISVNTNTPTLRFGGLAVYDSGSTGLTGSMLWDSEDNQWIYSNPSGSTYDSAVFLVGPRNSGVIGNEPGITCNFLSKGNGMHHMTSSAIFDDGSRTCFYGSSIITSTGVGCFSGAVCAASVVSAGTITGTTSYASTVACSPVVCAGTSCATSFVGGTVSGTTLYGSTAVCAPTVFGTTRVCSANLCATTTICGPAFIGGTVSGTTGTFSSCVTSTALGIGNNISGFGNIVEISNTNANVYPRVNRSSTSYEAGWKLGTGGSDSWYIGLRSADGVGSYHFYSYTTNSTVLAITCNGVACFQGTVCASSFSGAGTGLTGTASSLSIGGTAANATNASYASTAGSAAAVPWSGVLSGIRENYTLQFRPPDGVGSYAGFAFASPGQNENAGYFLVRGGADNDVYTNSGITLVADCGWVTIAQRTRSDRGVRIMTGASSVSRICVVSSGEILFTCQICAPLVYSTGDVIAYSDSSVKTNIRPIENALYRITNSRGILYDRTDICERDNIGFIAQELEEQFPELILTDGEGKKGVKYQNAVAVLFEAIKEQQCQIEYLKSKIG